MDKPVEVKGIDVPIVKLAPVQTRTVKPSSFAKLVANIRAVGLIEPLLVYQEGDQFLILDGYLRYQALIELGVEVVPCLALSYKDLYTAHRQVNHLSSKQEAKLLRMAMEHVDAKTLGEAFGIQKLGSKLGISLTNDLHPDIARDVEEGKLQRNIAQELAYVLPKRQIEIRQLMDQTKDESVAFVRAQVLRTPAVMRSKKKRGVSPWEKRTTTKRNLMRKFQEADKHYDFYAALYSQYTADLMKLIIHVRQIINRPRLHAFLAENYPDNLKLFDTVTKDQERKATV